MGLWPFRRSGGSDDSAPDAAPAFDAPPAPAAAPGDWATLPPLQRTVEPIGLTLGGRAFSATLATWQAPQGFLAPLGHDVGAGAPAGLLAATAVPGSVQRFAPPATPAGPPVLVSGDRADAPPAPDRPFPSAGSDGRGMAVLRQAEPTSAGLDVTASAKPAAPAGDRGPTPPVDGQAGRGVGVSRSVEPADGDGGGARTTAVSAGRGLPGSGTLSTQVVSRRSSLEPDDSAATPTAPTPSGRPPGASAAPPAPGDRPLGLGAPLTGSAPVVQRLVLIGAPPSQAADAAIAQLPARHARTVPTEAPNPGPTAITTGSAVQRSAAPAAQPHPPRPATPAPPSAAARAAMPGDPDGATVISRLADGFFEFTPATPTPAVFPSAPAAPAAASPSAGGDAQTPAPLSVPAVQRAADGSPPPPTPAELAPPPAAPGALAVGPGGIDLDALAGRLYSRISTRLRAELRLDRERAGLATDLHP